MKSNQDEFKRINDEVREMSRKEGEERFGVSSDLELIGYYGRGAILGHGQNVWFAENEAAYQNWVLGTLRIPLDLSKRLVRIYLAILHSGLTSKDFRGIRMSSALYMAPILRHLNSEGATPEHRERYHGYRECLPELLEVARTGTVQEVKALCYRLRGMKVSAGSAAKHAREVVRLGDWGSSITSLGHVGAALNGKGIPFAFFARDPDSGVAHYFVNRAGGEEFMKVWKEQCAPLLREATASMSKVAEKGAELTDRMSEMVEVGEVPEEPERAA